MGEINKRIKIDNKYYFLTKNDNFSTITSIKRTELNNEENKTITFCMWDDLSFIGWTNKENDMDDCIEFNFNFEDPLYFCLYHLLDNRDNLIIEDDESPSMQKYMMIIKEEFNIKIIFKSYLKEEELELPFDKYRIFIKNIGPDPRSKIENYEDKIKLIEFIRECEERLNEEYHQLTIEEYLEVKKNTRKIKGGI